MPDCSPKPLKLIINNCLISTVNESEAVPIRRPLFVVSSPQFQKIQKTDRI
jgi:hypothetical protein